MRGALTVIAPQDVQARVPSEPVRVLGMDLGTTNCAVTEIVVPPDTAEMPEVLCLDVEQVTLQGPYISPMVPSVLAIHDGRLLVGEGAKGLRARLSDFGLEQNRNIFWDCKNDIGVRRTYHKAPPGFRSASQVGGHLLRFLMDAAKSDASTPVSTTVVTTPASFQAAQRRDTVEAAELAGIEIGEGALLDEPIAAFIAYLVIHGKQVFTSASPPQRLVVFDFGGGTCDVALFRLLPSASGRSPVGAAPLAVSRYHRLGGGDIDRAIVIEVLMDQLLQQNGLDPHALDYGAKTGYVIPALLGAAESLKVGLCREIVRLQRFHRYDSEHPTLIQKNPGLYTCTLADGATLRLQSPTLSAVKFEQVLEPFLDSDMLHARDTEYLMTCSIFAPLQDTLERAGLEPDDVDCCLMVGGSSLIPQVAEAVRRFFRRAQVLRFSDAESTLTAVAQGAAWHALSLSLYGHGMVRPTAADRVSIRTAGGQVALIDGGAELPFPADGDWAENRSLRVPATGLTQAVELRVELCDSRDRVLMRRNWTIRPIVQQGDPLLLRFRMDANQVLHLELALAEDPDRDGFEASIENPLASVVNPHAKRDEILELEERMRTESMSSAQQRTTVKRIADLEADLGNREKALHLLSRVNRASPESGALTRMGIICGQMGDYDRQERLYREAARISPNWGGPLFNLALAQEQQGKIAEAMATIDEVHAAAPPYLVLKARLADKLRRPTTVRDALLDKAFARFDPTASLDDWALGWYETGAKLRSDRQREHEARAERQRRAVAVVEPVTGVLPEITHDIVKRT